jgi:hypothetical protein
MTKLYLDTEFNGFRGGLISMALVSPCAREWYEVVTLEGRVDPWVSQHVMPLLDKAPLSKLDFKISFHKFLLGFIEPEVICDWHADAVHFCECLSGYDYGSSLDFACKISILKTPPGQPVSLRPHNALADAKALMLWNEHR